jgi:hypothetical protein
MMLVGRRVLDAGSLWRVTRAALAAAGMLGVMYVLRPLGVAAAPGGVLAFVLLAGVLRIASPEEVAMLRSGFDKLRSRIRRRSEDPVRP